MADQQTPSPRRAAGPGKQTSPRRNDVIRCENCGEDYSVTYKRCPFCDERPGSRGGVYVGGKRVANQRGGGYGRPVNPIQIIWLVVSILVIVAALFIVIRFLFSSPLGGGGNSGSGSVDTSQTGGSSAPDGSGAAVPPDSSSASSSGEGGDVSEPEDDPQPDSVEPQSLTLNKSDITLWYNETTTLVATVTPADADAALTWTSSNPSILTVDREGNLQNINSGTTKENVTITVACGDLSASCIVRCNPGGSSGSGTSGNEGTGGSAGNTGTSTPVAPNTPGKIVNASSGLNIRSGPGTEYEKVASGQNGASVVILGEENGWYRIDYGGGRIGYVLKDYVSVNG